MASFPRMARAFKWWSQKFGNSCLFHLFPKYRLALEAYGTIFWVGWSDSSSFRQKAFLLASDSVFGLVWPWQIQYLYLWWWLFCPFWLEAKVRNLSAKVTCWTHQEKLMFFARHSPLPRTSCAAPCNQKPCGFCFQHLGGLSMGWSISREICVFDVRMSWYTFIAIQILYQLKVKIKNIYPRFIHVSWIVHVW